MSGGNEPPADPYFVDGWHVFPPVDPDYERAGLERLRGELEADIAATPAPIPRRLSLL